MDDVSTSGSPVRRIVVGLVALAAVGLVGGYGVAMRARPRPVSVTLESPAASDAGSRRLIFVHVGGAVRRPGLYELPQGSRVDDAVDAAGGVLEEANLDALNLAAKVRDGDKVLVPRQGEAAEAAPGGGPAPSGGTTQSATVNLNTATIADLETLPGIGPALAQRIIDYREANGGFRTVEDLMEVPGIGPKKFEQLRDHVSV